LKPLHSADPVNLLEYPSPNQLYEEHDTEENKQNHQAEMNKFSQANLELYIKPQLKGKVVKIKSEIYDDNSATPTEAKQRKNIPP